MAEITIEEARNLYESNESIRSFLESKFSKEELVGESIEEKFNRVWNDEILSKCDSVRFLDSDGNVSKIPTSRLEVLDSDGKWLFDYDYSEENKYFQYSAFRLYNILKCNVSDNLDILHPFIKKWIDKNLNIKGKYKLYCVPRENINYIVFQLNNLK